MESDEASLHLHAAKLVEEHKALGKNHSVLGEELETSKKQAAAL